MSLSHTSALHGCSYSSDSDKNGGVFVTLYLGGHWKLTTSEKELESQSHRMTWVVGTHEGHQVRLLALPRTPKDHSMCLIQYLFPLYSTVSRFDKYNCGFIFFLNSWYVYIIRKKINKTLSYFLFIVLIDPLDSICTNALAEGVQIFWQALLVGDRNTAFATGRMLAWLLLILGPGKS